MPGDLKRERGRVLFEAFGNHAESESLHTRDSAQLWPLLRIGVKRLQELTAEDLDEQAGMVGLAVGLHSAWN